MVIINREVKTFAMSFVLIFLFLVTIEFYNQYEKVSVMNSCVKTEVSYMFDSVFEENDINNFKNNPSYINLGGDLCVENSKFNNRYTLLLVYLLAQSYILTNYIGLNKHAIERFSISGINRINSNSKTEKVISYINKDKKLLEFLSNTENDKLKKYEENFNQNKLDYFIKMYKTLTPSELVVFKLYISDLKVREVADVLAVSVNTIKYHNKNIFSKLGVHSKKEIIFYLKKMQMNE